MEEKIRNFNLASYSAAKDKMIATNDTAYNKYVNERMNWYRKKLPDTPEQILGVINSESLEEQQKLSRQYFHNDGYYKRIIMYYATLLKYAGLLIPNPANGKSLSNPFISKRYYQALDYIEALDLPNLCTNFAQKALVDGCYYGIFIRKDRTAISILDLPVAFCRSRFKDEQGNDLIEFNVTYFNSITDEDNRKSALSVYPKLITKAYKDYCNGKSKNCWVIIPADLGLCFPMVNGRPFFLSIIPQLLEYDQLIDEELQHNEEDVHKILIQKIPHLQDGRLVFEPDEAQEMHTGAVSMMKSNRNVSVLTTYADSEVANLSSNSEEKQNFLNRIEQNIYAEAGVSNQLFCATGSSSIPASVKKDIAFMMSLANKFSRFITNFINDLFSNSNISFKYTILPVSYQDTDDYITNSFKLVNCGYSFLLPAVALGLSQRDLCNVKDLENEVLKLGDRLKPLQTSYTQAGAATSDEGGRPVLDDSQKSEVTIKKEESLEHQA